MSKPGDMVKLPCNPSVELFDGVTELMLTQREDDDTSEVLLISATVLSAYVMDMILSKAGATISAVREMIKSQYENDEPPLPSIATLEAFESAKKTDPNPNLN